MASDSPAESLANFAIRSPEGNVPLPIVAGRPVFVLGRNGTGKSGLVHSLYSQKSDFTVYIPGARPSYFDNEGLSLTAASRRQLTANMRGWDSSPDTRWKPVGGTARNEKAIHDLQAAELQFKVDAANEIAREGPGSRAVERLQSRQSPLDRVNRLLAQANLPIRVLVDGSELKAIREGEVYSIARTSDGERTALILAAEVVSAPMRTVFIVDEPELHLHRSIVVPLLAALIAERRECGFLVSTHELELPSEIPGASAVLVRGCTWNGGVAVSWDVDVLEDAATIPEDLRVDVLGSRRKIIFVEGTSTSLDQPLFLGGEHLLKWPESRIGRTQAIIKSFISSVLESLIEPVPERRSWCSPCPRPAKLIPRLYSTLAHRLRQ